MGKNNAYVQKFINTFKEIYKEIKDTLIYTKDKIKNIKIEDIKNSNTSKAYGVVGLLLVSIFIYLYSYDLTKAYTIYLDNVEIGSIKTEEEGNLLLKDLAKEISGENDAKVVLDDVLEFRKDNVRNRNLSDVNKIKEELKSKITYKLTGYVLEIDGEKVGTFKTGKDVEDIINVIKNEYISDSEDTEIEEVKILEDLQVKQKEVLVTEIDDKEDVLEYIKTGGEEVKTHTVEVGESYWLIARMYNTRVADLEKANPGKKSEDLRPGDEVKLVKETSKLTVATKEKKEVVEQIAKEVEIEYDDSMYKTEKKVKVEGSNGELKKTVVEEKRNGILFDVDVIDEQIVKEPVTKVVVQGTKEVPRTVATGSFLMPTRGRITSGFGRRWGRMHRGLDIAARTGTPIKAADGGTVSFAGWQGSYGYMVEIDHGNGYKTRYAHCSKIHVSKGKKVAKGDHIANVGNTGRSTGSHLHLEVIKNGAHQNPSNYVR